MINSVAISGRMVRDPDLRYTPQKGTAICEFDFAFDDAWGEYEHTSFIKAVSFGKTAENIAQYCGKGSKVVIQGSLRQDRWTSKDGGEKREKVKVVVQKVEFLDTKPRGNADEAEVELNSDNYKGDDDVFF